MAEGEWKVENRGIDWAIYAPDGGYTERLIATVRHIHPDSGAAHAHLIASAPRLLEALEAAVNEGILLWCICGTPGSGTPACRACNWIVPARAAIAAARGEA